MSGWNPEDNMGPFRWYWFKMGQWTTVESVPSWVESSLQEELARQDKWGGGINRTTTFEFTGSSLKYRVKVDTDERPVKYATKIK